MFCLFIFLNEYFRRAIQRYIEDELSDLILKAQLQNGQTVNISLDNDKLKRINQYQG